MDKVEAKVGYRIKKNLKVSQTPLFVSAILKFY